jgi:hypothetical protein
LTLYACILEVLGPIIGRIWAVVAEIFHDFSQSFQLNAGIVLRLGHGVFQQHILQIRNGGLLESRPGHRLCWKVFPSPPQSLHEYAATVSRSDRKHFIKSFVNNYSSFISHTLHVDNINIHRPINNTTTLAAWKNLQPKTTKLITLDQHPNELHSHRPQYPRRKGNAAQINTKQEITQANIF